MLRAKAPNSSRHIIAAALLALLAGCQTQPTEKQTPDIEVTDQTLVDQKLRQILSQHQINTAGIAVISNGTPVWHATYGDQAPGVPASERTLFNVASITKTVVAETVLRLAATGALSLDEPMSTYWIDPDLQDDSRHQLLTPRHALTHRTGFLNWRFFSDDGKLQFVRDPGTAFGYSGEGFNYLARFVERKLGIPFEELAREHVFGPAGVTDAALSVDQRLFPYLAQSLDSDGEFPGHYCRPEGWCREPGNFSAAGGMAISVSDYAKVLIQSMQGVGLTKESVDARNTLATKTYDIDCTVVPSALCPKRIGYGLGWHVMELEGDRTIGHLGSDWASVTMAYYYEDSRDGLVVFLNAPNADGIAAMVDILKLLDPDSPELHGYTARRERSKR
ncbi:MAG: serine hydrolase domain-containing protein [Pseudomonadota bacterium]